MPRTLTVDEVFHYYGLLLIRAHCRVRIFEDDGLPPVLLISECDDNEGPSITNSAELLYPAIIAHYCPSWLDQADALTLIEHYSGVRRSRHSSPGDTFDQVTFERWTPIIRQIQGKQRVVFGEPDWLSMNQEVVTQLIGELH